MNEPLPPNPYAPPPRAPAQELSGRILRYVLTLTLKAMGPLDIATLIDVTEHQGFRIAGRPSKTVSDALRWEISRGRVVRLGRSRYAFTRIPRSTEHDMRKAVSRSTNRMVIV